MYESTSAPAAAQRVSAADGRLRRRGFLDDAHDIAFARHASQLAGRSPRLASDHPALEKEHQGQTFTIH